uniref:neuronal cell adhesion molecule-like isoform X2 n=1 Tax=Myxine glutinosa TaxID=7769 RepID=UPI00358F5BD3
MPSYTFSCMCFITLLALNCHLVSPILEIPADVEKPPRITEQSPRNIIVDPRENIIIKCEGDGNPMPVFTWSKYGRIFDPSLDQNIIMKPGSGTLIINTTMSDSAKFYQGTYQCFAENSSGKALSQNITIQLSHAPLWPKESLKPITVKLGEPLILPCNPPSGLPPPDIFWMDRFMQRLPQNERVSQGLDSNLYFSNMLEKDARDDYTCFAHFPHTSTIQEKQPMTIVVKSSNAKLGNESEQVTNAGDGAPALQRPPSFLVPKDKSSTVLVLRGETMKLECIAEGLPTPQMHWYKFRGELPKKRLLIKNFNKTLSVENVTEADSGKYQCRANNALGDKWHTMDVTVEAAPYWILPQLENRLYSPGETAQLLCRAHGSPKPQIHWFVNGIPIEDAPPESGRQVHGDLIILRNLEFGSSAVYQCEATNKHGTILKNAYVKALSVAPRILTETNKLYVVQVGKTADIECRVFASPAASILWFKDVQGSMLRAPRYKILSNGTLHIPEVQETDVGSYTCVARNDLRSMQILAHLKVKEPTRLDPLEEYTVVRRGEDVSLNCSLRHDPSLEYTITWQYDNKDITSTARSTVDGSILMLSDVTEEQQGQYTCLAKTELDEDLTSTSLVVIDRPDPPNDLQFSIISNRSIQLSWKAGKNHNSRITGFILEEMMLGAPWEDLVHLSGLKFSHQLELMPFVSYRFRARAVNHIGLSEPSEATNTFTTSAAPPDVNPDQVKGEGMEPYNMVISWLSLKRTEHNGPGLRYRVSWQQQRLDKMWNEAIFTNASHYTVNGTPTFVPFHIRVQAINDVGEGPMPNAVLGNSGEDYPLKAPEGLKLDFLNSTTVQVSWKPLPADSVRGHLRGYKLRYWKVLELGNQRRQEPTIQELKIPPEQLQILVTGIEGYSLYQMDLRAYNGKGDGPSTPRKDFETPEGIPGQPENLEVQSSGIDSVRLTWLPPSKPGGILTGFKLLYQHINESKEPGPSHQVANILANATEWTVGGLLHESRYRFSLCALTHVGEGSAAIQEGSANEGKVLSYRLPLTNKGWFIGLMCAIALLVLILLIICFIRRSKGGKYPVKEKECSYPDTESFPMRDNILHECSEEDKPLRPVLHTGSSESGGRTPMALSGLAPTGDGSTFSEEESFVGQYADHRPNGITRCKGGSGSEHIC